MEPDGGLWIYIILLLFLIFLNAFFTISEISIISLNDAKIKKMAGSGNKNAKLLVKLTSSPTEFLAFIQAGVTFSGFLASAIASNVFSEYIVYWFRDCSIDPFFIKILSIAIISIILSYLTLVFGIFVPKRMAMQNYENIAFKMTKPIYFTNIISKPFIFLLFGLSKGILRLFGIDPDAKPEKVMEEEIRMMIDAGNENGDIEQIEKEMIHNIFEFDDRNVDEIMTHRTEITAIEISTPLDEVINIGVSEGYSRIPVYEDDLDNIVGILYVKDLLGLILKKSSKNFNVSDYMRKALYVPESNSCKDLFEEFQKNKIQMAVIVDEYGGTAGIVTMEDLIESIVGNIQDEYDDEDEEIIQISENTYKIDGIFALEKIERLFNIKFSEDEDFDYDTISGYITGFLERIPENDEHPVVSVENVDFIVLEVEDHRITSVKAVVKPLEEQTDSEN